MKLGGYWGNVLSVTAGTVVAQGIGLVGYVLLARIFSAADFGIYASWLAIVSILSVAITGALETSFVLDDDGADRRAALAATLATAAIGAALAGALTYPATRAIPSLFASMGAEAIAAICLGAFALAACNVFQSWAATSGHFRALTALRVVQSGGITFIPFAAGLISANAQTLILGHLAGLLLAAAVWLAHFRPRREDWAGARRLAGYWRKRRRYFGLVLPALTLGVVTANIPVLAVRARFGAEQAGLLALALRVLGAPMTLVGVAIRDVFKRHASVAYRERGECRREYVGSFLTLGAISIAFIAVMAPASEMLFALVFGEEWRGAGTMAFWLLPIYAAGIVASPLSYMVYIARREQVDLYWQVTLFALVGATLLLAPTVKGALIGYSIAYTSMYLLYLVLCYRMAVGKGGSAPADISGVSQGR